MVLICTPKHQPSAQSEVPALVPPKAGMAWPRKPNGHVVVATGVQMPSQDPIMSHLLGSKGTASKLLKSLANLQKVAAALDECIDLQKNASFLEGCKKFSLLLGLERLLRFEQALTWPWSKHAERVKINHPSNLPMAKSCKETKWQGMNAGGKHNLISTSHTHFEDSLLSELQERSMADQYSWTEASLSSDTLVSTHDRNRYIVAISPWRSPLCQRRYPTSQW